MTNIIVEGGPDRVSVVVPPSSIKVSYDVGRTGRRGSVWFAGSGAPGPLTIPEVELLVNDMYMDNSTGDVYQYILLPNNVGDWSRVGTVVGGAIGSVWSVAGRTGDVTLTVADLTDADSLATDTELADGLATKADATHTHTVSNVTGLQAALDSKQAAGSYAASTHTHAPADITGTAVITTDPRLSDARTPTTHTHTASAISDSTATGRSVLTAADAAAARTVIGAASSDVGRVYRSRDTGTTPLPLYSLIATATLGLRYADSVASFDVSGLSVSVQSRASVTFAVRQSADFGSDPIINIRVDYDRTATSSRDLTPSRFMAVVRQNTPTTIVELYVVHNSVYETLIWVPRYSIDRLNTGGTPVIFADQPELLSALPSGTVVSGEGQRLAVGELSAGQRLTVGELFLGGAAVLTGTGMPNGVVSAPVGSYYTDTAGTNGAWRWLKKSGTGSTGWVVVDGDTGWRNVNDLAINHPGIASGSIQIRRIGDLCYIRLHQLMFVSDHTTGTGMLISLPLGFVFGPISGIGSRSNGLASTVNVALTSGGQFYILNRIVDTPSNIIPANNWPLSCLLSGPTSQAWPTTLPGTPV